MHSIVYNVLAPQARHANFSAHFILTTDEKLRPEASGQNNTVGPARRIGSRAALPGAVEGPGPLNGSQRSESESAA
jgi:hypothetical protein